MILEIRIKNFYSIKDEVVLDLRAANLRSKKSLDLSENQFEWDKQNVLKSVAIYGANASGKSNIIKAIRFCARMVFQSHQHNENSTFNFKPFKFNDQNESSSFFIRFVSNEVEYEYAFSLTTNEILTESLHYYPNNRRAKVFERDETLPGEKSDKYSFGSAIKRPMDVAINTSNKSLFISRASQMDRELGKEIFTYFNETFILGYLDFSRITEEELFTMNKEFLLQALQIADSDIVDIRMEKQKVVRKIVGLNIGSDGNNEVSWDDKEEEEISFKTYHKADPSIAFDFDTEESAGTKKMFHILLRIIDIVKNDKILLIDEIEDSLHSKIVEFIVQLFHKSKRSQLLFSTHNTNLLDLNFFRKDQIYFVNKNEKGSSELYSLYDYKDFRDNMDPEKGYLQGRFDAIPYVDLPDNLIKSVLNG